MEEKNVNGQETHGGMNHGMGMMLLGCLLPVAAILLLPRLGVSVGVAFAVGIGLMIVLHAGMMVVPRLRRGAKGKASSSLETGHEHH